RSFHMFAFSTARDGRMQLESLAQSGFDPLSRTCRFMLTEEAHHRFVGETGIGRTIQRTCEAMKAAGIEDPSDVDKVRDLGVIDLSTMQKKLNLHYSLSLDLFGSEVSTNAANAFNASLKGRFQETKIEDDHKLEWLPAKADGDFIQSLMRQVVEPGKFASWIAPPRVGIDNKPGDFEYVKLAA